MVDVFKLKNMFHLSAQSQKDQPNIPPAFQRQTFYIAFRETILLFFYYSRKWLFQNENETMPQVEPPHHITVTTHTLH